MESMTLKSLFQGLIIVFKAQQTHGCHIEEDSSFFKNELAKCSLIESNLMIKKLLQKRLSI